MFEKDKLLLASCERAATKKDIKKLRELTERIDRLLAEGMWSNRRFFGKRFQSTPAVWAFSASMSAPGSEPSRALPRSGLPLPRR